MSETEWDIQEIKHLKKKLLIWDNLLFLLTFIVVNYLGASVPIHTLFLLACILLWVTIVAYLYTLITGKIIGTKARKREQAFDRDYLGRKRWKGWKIAEIAIIGFFNILITLMLIFGDLSYANLSFYDSFPFIGGWLGHNIGEISRISKL